MDSTPRPRRAPYVPISRRQQSPADSYQPRPRQPMSPPEAHQPRYHQPRSPLETQQPLSRQSVSPPDSQSSPNNVASGSRAPSKRRKCWGPDSHQQEVSRQRQLMTPPDSQNSLSNVASGSRRPLGSARDAETYQSMSRQPTSPPDVQNSPSNINYDLARRTNAQWRGPRARKKGSSEAKRGVIYVHSPEYGRRECDNRAPSVQPHSSQPGPNRDGWSERKCRNTLVRLCSHIPRNLNYRDGYHKIVYILRDVVGDENLDLALGVLFELIEVNDTVDTWEEGSPYRRWTHDHLQRHADLCCHHTVRLKNVVMGAHVPTEKLIQWRKEQHREHLAASFNPSMRRFVETGVIDGVVTTTTGIRNRQSWQINHSVYVSTPNGGTRVIFCPTPAQVNAMAFHEGVARGQRHHAATLPSPPAEVVARPSTFNYLPSTPPPTPTLSVVVEKESSKWKRSFKKVGGKLKGAFCVRRSKSAEKAEEDIALTEMVGSPGRSSDTIDDEVNKVAELSPEGMKEYINADGSKRVVLENFPLPMNAQVNGLFMRKHCLIDDEVKDLPEDVANLPFYTAEEKALRDELALKLSMRSPGDTNADVFNIRTTFKPFKGPFTADLFKDGGLDFKWKSLVGTVVEEEEVISPTPRR